MKLCQMTIGVLCLISIFSACTPDERDVCNQNLYDCVVGSILCSDGTVLSLNRWQESEKDEIVL